MPTTPAKVSAMAPGPASANTRANSDDAAGFSLIEVLVSMLLLTGALLSLAQVFTLGLAHASTSSANLVAREKAREAVESVHSARDTRTVAWRQIRNATARMCPGVATPPGWIATGGLFIDGVQPGGLHLAGPDGLINTAGDENVPLERLHHLGGDGRINTADDYQQDLRDYEREIWICDQSLTLREVRVTVTYRVGNVQRRYRLTTYVSNYS
jgi:type II secretory pathway pseudopilin PulG